MATDRRRTNPIAWEVRETTKKVTSIFMTFAEAMEFIGECLAAHEPVTIRLLFDGDETAGGGKIVA